MDRQKQLMNYVKRAQRSLNAEKLLPMLQYGIFLSLISGLAILIVSRFFVFAYYDETALMIACAAFVATVGYMWFKRVRTKEALRKLDAFYPYNELVTAFSFKQDEHPLADSILNKAVNESEEAYERFKKRKKHYWRPKTLVGILIAAIITGTLLIFPSETQQDAQVAEKEKEVIREIEKEVAKLEKKAQSEDAKKEMKELLEKLKEVETSEQALREVVKKQKELNLQEQKLQDKKLAENGEGAGLTDEEVQKLKDIAEIKNALAKSASGTQTALSKLGKPISIDLQNTISKMAESQNGTTSGKTSNNPSGTGNNQQQNNGQTGQGSTGSGNNQGQGNNGSGNNQGQGRTGSGSGQGQGSGSGTSGQGQGGGSESGGQGGGASAGSGAGTGMGGRSLLSIPSERVGESGGPTVDGGPLGEGDSAGEQKGTVPVTKGTVRPYEEVVGQYEERYMQSTKRLQLPRDLQNVVESYFSSIQSEE